MTTATQLGNAAQPMPENPLLQQPSAAVAPAQAPAASASQQNGAMPEAPPFDAELQALLTSLTSAPADQPTSDSAAQMPPIEAGSLDQGPEQAEALLGLLAAQQQQQVQAQQVPQTPANRASAPGETLLPADVLARQAAGAAVVREAAEAPLPAQPQQQPRPDTASLFAATRAEAPMPLGSGESQAVLETLPAIAAARSLGDTAPASGGASTGSPAAAVAERLVRLEGNDAQRGEQMWQALRHNVQLQIQQSQQVATIRLDPPELGSLEIQVTQESGKISVQINAAQADTLRLLQQTSDRLRHELLTQQFVQVNVQVGGDGRSGQQSRQNQEGSGEVLVRVNPLHDSGPASRTAPRDVLATV